MLSRSLKNKKLIKAIFPISIIALILLLAKTAIADKNGPIIVAWDFHVRNSCRYDINLLVRYKKVTDEWETAGRWTIDGNESTRLLVDGSPLRSNNSIFYYYAWIPGSDYSWNGSYEREFNGRFYNFRRANLDLRTRYGDDDDSSSDDYSYYSLGLNCSNL